MVASEGRFGSEFNHYAVSAYLSEREGRERVSVLTMVDLRGTEAIYDKDYGVMREQTALTLTPWVATRPWFFAGLIQMTMAIPGLWRRYSATGRL